MSQVRKLLFIKPSSLGDIVHAMPTLAALRKVYPQAQVTWLVKQQWAGIVERIEGVDRVWQLESGVRGWMSQVPALRAEHFDLVVDLQGLLRSAFMGWLTGATVRVGFANGREGSPWFYSHRITVPTVEMHAVDRYLLAATLHGAASTERAEFRFRIAQSDHHEVDRHLSQAGVVPGSTWMAVNVSARWPTKRWPADSYATVADRLQQAGMGSVVFIGGPEERADAAQVMRLMKRQAIDMTGSTAVGLLPALLAKASILITNDSGPMHVAAAVGTPVVAMFGPTSAVRTGPYGAGHRVLSGSVPCRPCFSRSCRNAVQLECMQLIAPDDVVAAVKAQLATRLAPR